MATLTICLFGNMHITRDGRESIRLKPATRSMLAFLLLYQYEHPRTTGPRRDLLASQFWADYDERQARRCLSTTLWRLRRSLEAAGIPGDTYIVTNNNDEVGFNFASDHWLDVAAFEEQVDRGLARPVDNMTPADVQTLEEAQALYVGDLFENCYDDWILRHRERLHLKFLACLGRLMRFNEARGTLEKCLEYGRKILDLDPLREQVHRYMMRLYARNGQKSLAVQQYQACRQVLKEELNIEPMTETQALYSQITSGNHAVPMVPARREPRDPLQDALQQLRQAMQTLAEAQDQLEEAQELVTDLTRKRGASAPIQSPPRRLPKS